MSALIVGGAPVAGADQFYRDLLRDSRFVIAADSAGEWAVQMGRPPDVVVGDFDSARPGAVERLREARVQVRTYSAEKDHTDLDLCVREARDRGIENLTFTAAFTGRLDHTLAALGTVLAASDLHSTIREPAMTALALDAEYRSDVRLGLEAGILFSLMPFAGARGVTIQGAKYPLGEASLGPLESRGVSNEASGGPLLITLGSGSALLIVWAESIQTL